MRAVAVPWLKLWLTVEPFLADTFRDTELKLRDDDDPTWLKLRDDPTWLKLRCVEPTRPKLRCPVEERAAMAEERAPVVPRFTPPAAPRFTLAAAPRPT
jgi:hypothetical protein